MQPRLDRYDKFIKSRYITNLVKNKEYELGLKQPLSDRIKKANFKNVLFTGMGCSAIVSEIIKGFFTQEKVGIYVDVINDYDVDYFFDKNNLEKDETLIIVSSYSGHSQEPIKAYYNLKKYNDNILFLTSNGQLAQIAKEENVSVIFWRLSEADREYPLFHAPQYFAILLDVFNSFGFINSNYEQELGNVSTYLKTQLGVLNARGKDLAMNLQDANIILLASARWHGTLLKLVQMHLNEIAMAPAHRNYIHEFCHSEVATLTAPKMKHAVLLFLDSEDDEYTREKTMNLTNILSENIDENKNVFTKIIQMDQANFFEKMFSTLLLMQYTTYHLGIYYNTHSREIISRAAGNDWYNIKTINKDVGNAEEYVKKT